MQGVEARNVADNGVAVGLTGAVAVVPTALWLLSLRRGPLAPVAVLATATARRFLPADILTVLSGVTVSAGRGTAVGWDRVPTSGLLAIVPATANILGKAAHGIADEEVSIAIAAAARPVLFVPSMNGAMWDNVRVRRNVALLRSLGHTVMEPGPGLEVADLRPTNGAMPPYPRIEQAMMELLNN